MQEVTSTHISYFRSILPSNCIQTEDLDEFNSDWLKEHKGNSPLVLKPTTTAQVSSIMKYCNDMLLPVVPQGGNTGLVAGGVPVDKEIVLSLRNLNKIERIEETQGIVWSEAGVILEDLQNFCNNKGWIVPLDLASKGSCQIGGNIATNAGGVRYIRYGSLHGNVLGVEAVLPNGEILSDLRALRKDNTGLDCKQVFIGSEGSLGIITKVALLLAPKPSSINTAFLACNSFEDVLKTLGKAKSRLNEVLSAYEFIDSLTFDTILKHTPRTRNPFSTPYNFYVLVETSGSNDSHDSEKMDKFLEEAFNENLIVDGVKAQDSSQADNFWRIRENGAVATRTAAKHALFKFDFSMRLPEIYKFVETVRERMGSLADVMGYGHVGDGNLHLTIISDFPEEAEKLVYPFLYEEVKRMKGSISAEHGIGLFKKGKIGYSKDQNLIEYMVIDK